MSTNEKNYEAALVAVVAALDTLCDTHSAVALGHEPSADDYDHQQHIVDCARSNGVTEAYWMVKSMLDDYRTQGRSVMSV